MTLPIVRSDVSPDSKLKPSVTFVTDSFHSFSYSGGVVCERQ